jgi:hypothetical protein
MTAARNYQAGTAQAVTVMTNPSFLSGFFFIALAMSFVSVGSRLMVALVGAGFASILPILTVIALRNAGLVTDLALRERAERPVVYAACALVYAAGAAILITIGAPWQVWGVMVLHLPMMAVLSVLTPRAKISIHTTGVAALWSASLILWGPVALPLGVVLPLAAWARWAVGAHTRHELATGALLGLVSTGAGLLLLGTFVGK